MSQIWASLTWFNLIVLDQWLGFKLEPAFDTAQIPQKILLHSKVTQKSGFTSLPETHRMYMQEEDLKLPVQKN